MRLQSLSFVKYVFNDVSFSVKFSVMLDRYFPASTSRNAGRDVPILKFLPEPVCIVSPVCNELAGFRKNINHSVSRFDITGIFRCQKKNDRPSFPVTHGMEF